MGGAFVVPSSFSLLIVLTLIIRVRALAVLSDWTPIAVAAVVAVVAVSSLVCFCSSKGALLFHNCSVFARTLSSQHERPPVSYERSV